MFERYIYVSVCFLRGSHPYTYRTTDRSIRVNDVVMVPAGDEVKPAIVTGVKVYKKNDALPYPLEKTKMILGRADRKTKKLFKGIDMRMPVDISVTTMKTYSGTAQVVTDKHTRDLWKRELAKHPELKKVETQPVRNAGKILSRDDKGKKNRIAFWYREDHIMADDTYRCSHCNSIYSHKTPFCPHCHYEMKKEKYNPTIVEEFMYEDGE